MAKTRLVCQSIYIKFTYKSVSFKINKWKEWMVERIYVHTNVLVSILAISFIFIFFNQVLLGFFINKLKSLLTFLIHVSYPSMSQLHNTLNLHPTSSYFYFLLFRAWSLSYLFFIFILYFPQLSYTPIFSAGSLFRFNLCETNQLN